jgi:macrolide transport system ATP-binding/permease protein
VADPPQADAVIDLENVEKIYASGEVSFRALRGVSLRVTRGEFVAIVGASGSGKSTLMNVIGCLDRATTGSYVLAGHDVADFDAESLAVVRNQLLGFIFQGFHLLPRTSALENVELPLVYRGVGGAERQARAATTLALVGLGDRLHNTPAQLSGGQQQRVAVARALVTKPAVLLADEPTGNLDSRTTEDVLAMLQWLNRERGLTIVLVTHDVDVARCASRIVTMKDGEISSDERSASPRIAHPSTGEESWGANDVLEQQDAPRAAHTGVIAKVAMTWMAMRLALRALGRNKLRASLTVLGILIGVAAVVAMTTIGAGAKARVEAQMAALGVNMLVVYPGSSASGGARGGQGSVSTLTEDDAAAIEREIPSVQAVAPTSSANVQVVAGANNTMTRATGTTPPYFAVRGWDVERGALFEDSDQQRRVKVCLLGQTTEAALFPEGGALGQRIRVGRVPCTVIGVLKKKGQSGMGQDQDDIVVLPLSTFRAGVGRASGRSVQQIMIAARSPELTAHAQDAVTSLLRQRHRAGGSGGDDFSVRNLEELARSFDEQRQTVTTLLLAVASIALLVGGIGVMNIMLVSVTERTREIGIRLAIGARAPDVLAQFLIEAVMLSAIGGFAGLATGYGVSAILTVVTEWTLAFQPQSALIAIGVSTAIGVIFGYFPARRAAHLDPITALRHE